MNLMLRHLPFWFIAVCSCAGSPLDEPVVRKDVAYADGVVMDIYQPAKLAAGARLPVIVLLNTDSGSTRGSDFYIRWARSAAAQGFVAVNPDTQSGRVEERFDQLLAWLVQPQHGGEFHFDANRIAVYAGSGNVSRAFPLVEDPKRTDVKAAVMYYGAATVPEFRPDLPVLFVRAGLDRPPVNRRITELAAEALRQNAPITLLNYAGGHHGFETADDNDATREVLAQTFHFLHSVLSPKYQDALRERAPEASAAAAVIAGDSVRAARLYAELVMRRPREPHLLLSYGEALVGAGRYKEARAQFDILLPMRAVGPRDLAIPAATACVLDEDPAAAVEWLKTIPKQYRPPSMVDSDVFRPLRDREDFKSLFR